MPLLHVQYVLCTQNVFSSVLCPNNSKIVSLCAWRAWHKEKRKTKHSARASTTRWVRVLVREREQRPDWNECVNTEQRVKCVFKNVFAIWIETALDALEFRYARTLSHILLFLLFLKYSHLQYHFNFNFCFFFRSFRFVCSFVCISFSFLFGWLQLQLWLWCLISYTKLLVPIQLQLNQPTDRTIYATNRWKQFEFDTYCEVIAAHRHRRPMENVKRSKKSTTELTTPTANRAHIERTGDTRSNTSIIFLVFLRCCIGQLLILRILDI